MTPPDALRPVAGAHPSVVRLAELLSRAETLADEEAVLLAGEAAEVQSVVERILELLPFVELARQIGIDPEVGWGTVSPVTPRPAPRTFRERFARWGAPDPTVRVAVCLAVRLAANVYEDRVAVSEEGLVYRTYQTSGGGCGYLLRWAPGADPVPPDTMLEALRAFEASLADLPDRMAARQAERRRRLAR